MIGIGKMDQISSLLKCAQIEFKRKTNCLLLKEHLAIHIGDGNLTVQRFGQLNTDRRLRRIRCNIGKKVIVFQT